MSALEPGLYEDPPPLVFNTAPLHPTFAPSGLPLDVDGFVGVVVTRLNKALTTAVQQGSARAPFSPAAPASSAGADGLATSAAVTVAAPAPPPLPIVIPPAHRFTKANDAVFMAGADLVVATASLPAAMFAGARAPSTVADKPVAALDDAADAMAAAAVPEPRVVPTPGDELAVALNGMMTYGGAPRVRLTDRVLEAYYSGGEVAVVAEREGIAGSNARLRYEFIRHHPTFCDDGAYRACCHARMSCCPARSLCAAAVSCGWVTFGGLGVALVPFLQPPFFVHAHLYRPACMPPPPDHLHSCPAVYQRGMVSVSLKRWAEALPLIESSVAMLQHAISPGTDDETFALR